MRMHTSFQKVSIPRGSYWIGCARCDDYYHCHAVIFSPMILARRSLSWTPVAAASRCSVLFWLPDAVNLKKVKLLSFELLNLLRATCTICCICYANYLFLSKCSVQLRRCHIRTTWDQKVSKGLTCMHNFVCK